MYKLILALSLLSTTITLYANDLNNIESSVKSYEPQSELERANQLTALGSIKQKVRDYESAITLYRKSLIIRDSIGDRYSKNYALTLYLIAISQYRLDKYCEASETIKTVIHIYQEIGEIELALHAEEEGLKKFNESCSSLFVNN